MKNIIRYAAAFCAALAALACSKDDAATPETGNPDGTAPFTITASIASPADTRISMDDNGATAIDLKWDVGDKIYVINGDGSSETVYTFTASTVESDGKTAVFTAPDGYTGTPKYAIHCGKTPVSALNPATVSGNLHKYSPSTGDLPDDFPLYGKYDGATRLIVFKPLLALLKFSITFPQEVTGALGELQIASASGADIFYSGDYDITGEPVARAGGSMLASISYTTEFGLLYATTTTTLYIPIDPGTELSGESLEITLPVGNNLSFATTIKGGNLVAGKCYPLTLPADKWTAN